MRGQGICLICKRHKELHLDPRIEAFVCDDCMEGALGQARAQAYERRRGGCNRLQTTIPMSGFGEKRLRESVGWAFTHAAEIQRALSPDTAEKDLERILKTLDTVDKVLRRYFNLRKALKCLQEE